MTLIWPAYRRKSGLGPDKLGGKFAKKESSGLSVRIDPTNNVIPTFKVLVDNSTIKAAEKAARKEGNKRSRR